MRVLDAVKSLQLGKKKERAGVPLRTVWSEKAEEGGNAAAELQAIPLPEYPRPQLVRRTWKNLNGLWDYAFGKAKEEYPGAQGKIMVPYSPESELSGVGRVLQPGEALWYE
ncbi:MAG: hypothetical protein J6M58_04495, partial [Clostridium sp.]|nr:hypothetical protein [Clostridium sp.]